MRNDRDQSRETTCLEYERHGAVGPGEPRGQFRWVALTTNGLASAMLLLFLANARTEWGAKGTAWLLGSFLLAIPLFLLNMIMALVSLASFSKFRSDPVVCLCWALFAGQAVFWVVILILNMRNSA